MAGVSVCIHCETTIQKTVFTQKNSKPVGRSDTPLACVCFPTLQLVGKVSHLPRHFHLQTPKSKKGLTILHSSSFIPSFSMELVFAYISVSMWSSRRACVCMCFVSLCAWMSFFSTLILRSLQAVCHACEASE